MRATLLFALILTLAGCASTTQVVTRSTVVAPKGPAHSLLLVAQTPENDIRETWELTCEPIFARTGLAVSLSHQSVPLWQNQGRDALLDWARKHQVDRILIVNLTGLLMQPPQFPNRHSLNPMNENQPPATFHIGIGGTYKEPKQPPETQSYPVDLLNADGGNLWHGLARTHEANDEAAIAKSQCTALRNALEQKGLLP